MPRGRGLWRGGLGWAGAWRGGTNEQGFGCGLCVIEKRTLPVAVRSAQCGGRPPGRVLHHVLLMTSFLVLGIALPVNSKVKIQELYRTRLHATSHGEPWARDQTLLFFSLALEVTGGRHPYDQGRLFSPQKGGTHSGAGHPLSQDMGGPGTLTSDPTSQEGIQSWAQCAGQQSGKRSLEHVSQGTVCRLQQSGRRPGHRCTVEHLSAGSKSPSAQTGEPGQVWVSLPISQRPMRAICLLSKKCNRETGCGGA